MTEAQYQIARAKLEREYVAETITKKQYYTKLRKLQLRYDSRIR